jgi:hypothetical protein
MGEYHVSGECAVKPIWRQLIAVMEMTGGVFGLATIISRLIFQQLDPTSLNLVWLLIAIYMLALFAGIMLWRNTRVGRLMSIVSQIIQLPKLLSPEFAFMVSYGFDLSWMSLARADRTEWSFDFRAPSYYLLINNTGLWQKGIGVSFVSLLALRLLLKGNRVEEMVPKRAEPTKTASIGGASHLEWVRPTWMVVVGILVAILLTTCAGLSILSWVFKR